MFEEINGNRWWLATRRDLYQELFAFISALQVDKPIEQQTI